MVKWSFRDRWGKLTEKQELTPEMREMLLQLEGVYERPASGSSQADETAPREKDSDAHT